MTSTIERNQIKLTQDDEENVRKFQASLGALGIVAPNVIKLDDGSWKLAEEEEEEECCQSCGTTCLDHSSNKGRGSEEACHDCTEIRCKHCPCECDEGYSFDVVPC